MLFYTSSYKQYVEILYFWAVAGRGGAPKNQGLLGYIVKSNKTWAPIVFLLYSFCFCFCILCIFCFVLFLFTLL